MKKILTILLLTFIYNVQGQVINHTVYFDSGKSVLASPDKQWLDSVSAVLKGAGEYSLVIRAYCDADGSLQSNMLLSQARAKVVKEAFVNAKLDAKFIVTNAEGEADPVADNSTEQGKAKNRRATIAVTYSSKIQVPPVVEEGKNNTVPNNASEDKPKEKINIGLSSENLEVGKKMVLKNLNFEGGTAVLLPESEPVLKELLKFMKDHPTIEIEIGGHVCCGPDMELSVLRAKKVFSYLKGYGISEKRMTYKGYSFDKPLAAENTEEGRKTNRRVEITILKL
jgi:outer membrane protein OmpA-like peptidoglycan-associated protein